MAAIPYAVSYAATDGVLARLEPGERAKVVEVVDGDTVLLDDGWQVRLVGIQAPKLPLGRKNFNKWPLADESKSVLEALVLDRQVTLAYGGQRVDRHGRRLAHLFLGDETWIQGELLSAGMARVYSFPDNRAVVAEMLVAEGSARHAGAGIWGNDWYRVRTPDALARDIGGFQLVEGRVVDAADVRGTVYLNFGADWRSDFTIKVAKRHRKSFEAAGFDLLALKGRTVRVRGWLDEYNGPMIEATHLEQIEILDN
ncbi:MAG: thermonuclease family protein [Proteobacteria bacterium]|nr:thermonuclease family protein [Pseudomonadota bacterium]